jgi:hypothetical protein
MAKENHAGGAQENTQIARKTNRDFHVHLRQA